MICINNIEELENRIFCEDCISDELNIGINKIPDESINLIITDPPYLHEKGGRGKFLTSEALDRKQFNMKQLGNFGEKEIYNFLNKTQRLMKKPQWYIFCSEKQIVYYLKWCLESKYKYNILTMNKPLSILNRERYSTNIEYIIRIYSKGCALNKLDLKNNPEQSHYYSKYKQISKIKNKIHPSQKPDYVIKQILEVSTKKNDIILDLYTGSGTIPLECIKSDRKFIAFDNGLDEKTNRYWSEIAQKRINTYIK
ncbi:site-specific DNA-methyltransferase [Clostridium sporogenes]|nr:site-specific DNA-methyltransferase [Clostridium sporogenes]